MRRFGRAHKMRASFYTSAVRRFGHARTSVRRFTHRRCVVLVMPGNQCVVLFIQCIVLGKQRTPLGHGFPFFRWALGFRL